MKTLRQILEALPERPVHRALKLVSRLADRELRHDELGQMRNVVKPGWHPRKGEVNMGKFWKYGQHAMVPLNKIYSEQSYLGVPELKAKIDGSFGHHYGQEDPPNHAYIIKHQGVYHVYNGNHRVSAARLLRKSHIHAIVLHLNDDGSVNENPPKLPKPPEAPSENGHHLAAILGSKFTTADRKLLDQLGENLDYKIKKVGAHLHAAGTAALAGMQTAQFAGAEGWESMIGAGTGMAVYGAAKSVQNLKRVIDRTNANRKTLRQIVKKPEVKEAVERTPERAIAVIHRAAKMKQFHRDPTDSLGKNHLVQMRPPGFPPRKVDKSTINHFHYAKAMLAREMARQNKKSKRKRETVPIHLINIIQPSISRDEVIRKIKGTTRNKTLDKPIRLYRWKGMIFQTDGNHRTAAHKALGKTHIKAWVTDIPD